jgi:MFS family permease
MKLLDKLKQSVSNPQRRYFLNLIVFYSSFAWFKSFSYSVLVPHYDKQGISLQQMVIGDIFYFLIASLFILFVKTIYSRNSWRLALITSIISLFLIINITNVYQFYLASIIAGLTVVFYYIPYNIAHFNLTPKHRTGLSSGIMFSLTPIIGLAAPLIAGLMASFSYLYIWIFSFIFFLLSFFLSFKQYNFKINYQISLKSIKPTLIFSFLQALWEPLVFTIIPFFSLFFIKSPLYFGAFISYLSLMSVVANLTLGKLTDKLQKRIVFLYPLTIIMGLVTFLFPLTLTKIIWWVIITGIIQFFTPLFWNLSTSMFVDTTKKIKTGFVTRELVLSIGRLISCVLIAINFYFQPKPTYIFYFLGSVMLLYPIVLFYNTKISKRYNYL